MAGDAMTPAWSRQLALLCQSSIWHDEGGQERKEAFIEKMERYANYDALPSHLKALYERIYREVHEQNRGGRRKPR